MRGFDAEADREVCFADTGWAEQDHVLRFRDERCRREVSEDIATQRGLMVGVEVVQGLHRGEVSARDSQCRSVRFPVRDLALQDRGEVFLVGPALGAGLIAEGLPDPADRGGLQRPGQVSHRRRDLRFGHQRTSPVRGSTGKSTPNNSS